MNEPGQTEVFARDAYAPEVSHKLAEELLPLVYDELRKLAAQRLAQERAGHTLQPTALVHEAYIRLTATDGAQRFQGRGHFFSAVAEAMRRVLIDRARAKGRQKRGQHAAREELGDCTGPHDDPRLLELDIALQALAREDALAARVVELRFFGGLGHEPIAETLQISVYEARQKWTYARAWLTHELRSHD